MALGAAQSLNSYLPSALALQSSLVRLQGPWYVTDVTSQLIQYRTLRDGPEWRLRRNKDYF